MKFNSELWEKNINVIDRSGYSPRQKMLKDVIKNILPGKNKSEIEQLLGESLSTDYFRSIDMDLIYLMGNERSLFAIDSEWLLIWLDENGEYEKFKLMTD